MISTRIQNSTILPSCPKSTPHHLQLRLRPQHLPRSLQHLLHLGRPHNISLNLQLPAHKQLLRIRLPLHQLSKILIAQNHLDIGLRCALRLESIAHLAGGLEVEVPRRGAAVGFLEREGEEGFCAQRFLLEGGVREGGGEEGEDGGGGEGG